jgi:hypothetical protein
MWIEPEVFEPVEQILKEMGYESFSSPGDRHGSWQWPFYQKSGGMTRFVTLAATPEESGSAFQVELWIGAEADQRFTRERIESLRWNAGELAEKAKGLILNTVRAVMRANALSLSDLKAGPTSSKVQAVPASAH